MPDRAKISKGFPRCYQPVWEKIENDQPIISISESAVDAVKSDIQSNGLGSDQFIDEIGKRLKIFEQRSFMNQIVRWDKEHETLRSIKEQIIGNEIALECVERAGQKILIDLEAGQRFNDIKRELQLRFEKEFFDARFSLPIEASDAQKMLYNHCDKQIVNMLRESHEGRNHLIENPEDGDLTSWNFG